MFRNVYVRECVHIVVPTVFVFLLLRGGGGANVVPFAVRLILVMFPLGNAQLVMGYHSVVRMFKHKNRLQKFGNVCGAINIK